MEIQAGSFQGRRIWVDANYAWGDFYSGNINILQASLGVNISKHFNLRTDYIYNYIDLPEGKLGTNELAEYFNIAVNPRLDLTMFIQWNSLDDLLFGNFRLHWIPKIGSDLYVVYNRGYNKLDNLKFRNPDVSSGAAKFVWRFTF